MWSGPDGLCGWPCAAGCPAEVAAEGSFAGPWQNRDRYGSVGLVCGTWRAFFLTGCEDCPPISLEKVLEVKGSKSLPLPRDKGIRTAFFVSSSGDVSAARFAGHLCLTAGNAPCCSRIYGRPCIAPAAGCTAAAKR